MTDKELRKLTRAELLELLLVQSKEIDRLNAELEQLQIQMQQREKRKVCSKHYWMAATRSRID